MLIPHSHSSNAGILFFYFALVPLLNSLGSRSPQEEWEGGRVHCMYISDFTARVRVNTSSESALPLNRLDWIVEPVLARRRGCRSWAWRTAHQRQLIGCSSPPTYPPPPQPGGGGQQFSLLWTAEEELQTNLARGWKIDSQSLGKDTNQCSYVTNLPLEWTNVSIPIKLAGAMAIFLGKKCFFYYKNKNKKPKPSLKPWRLTGEGSVNGQVLRTQRRRDRCLI